MLKLNLLGIRENIDIHSLINVDIFTTQDTE